MPKLRDHLVKAASRLPVGDLDRRAALGLVKKGALRDGPVGEVLDRYWNTIHELESDLTDAINEYDTAASYAGGPGRQDAQAMLKEIQLVINQLEALSTRAFSKLVDAESKFVREHGTPEDYTERMRDEMFPM